jgi:hypothetical protein
MRSSHWPARLASDRSIVGIVPRRVPATMEPGKGFSVPAIAFMVMPFAKKKTGTSAAGAPPEVDFDALWHRVHAPALEALGYHPVRADQDVGALIIDEMLQRLAIADLVVADVSLPNANVYYEIGVRHAARRTGCVLVAADWAQAVFDLAQMRQLRYPLADGTVGDDAAAAARMRLEEALRPLVGGDSPVFTAVPGYPDAATPDRVAVFRDVVDELLSFDVDVREVRLLSGRERRDAAARVIKRHGNSSVVREVVALELIALLRDEVGWQETLDYIGRLPDRLQRHPLVVEQRCLALSEAGDVARAAAELEVLIACEGATSERLGLLGGRHKRLFQTAATDVQRRRHLDAAIDSYERGMLLDLNDYYPASNLARLARARGADGDDQRAATALAVTAVACRRVIDLGVADPWARPTLLGAAFDRSDVAGARRLADEVEGEGAARWQLATTLSDLRHSLEQQADPDVRSGLEAVLVRLERLQKSEDD